jgi:hypothetical protein
VAAEKKSSRSCINYAAIFHNYPSLPVLPVQATDDAVQERSRELLSFPVDVSAERKNAFLVIIFHTTLN